jgi:hypothetical protein
LEVSRAIPPTPGPFGNYLHATTATVKRSIGGEGANVTETQDWMFQAASASSCTSPSSAASRSVVPPGRRHSIPAKDPDVRQLSQQEQALEVLRHPTTNPADRVKSYAVKGSGWSCAKSFDGTERTVSRDNILPMMRTVSK